MSADDEQELAPIVVVTDSRLNAMLADHELGRLFITECDGGYEATASIRSDLDEADQRAFCEWTVRCALLLAQTDDPAGDGWHPDDEAPGTWSLTCSLGEAAPSLDSARRTKHLDEILSSSGRRLRYEWRPAPAKTGRLRAVPDEPED